MSQTRARTRTAPSEDERTNHEAAVSLLKSKDDKFPHTCWSRWKVKEIQHGHARVLSKYDQGQEGLSLERKLDFKIENTMPGGILHEREVVVATSVAGCWKGEGACMLIETFTLLKTKMCDFPTPVFNMNHCESCSPDPLQQKSVMKKCFLTWLGTQIRNKKLK